MKNINKIIKIIPIVFLVFLFCFSHAGFSNADTLEYYESGYVKLRVLDGQQATI